MSKIPKPETCDLAFIEALRDQATRDAESSARSKSYDSAARWQTWANAYDHLLVMVRSQSKPHAPR